MLSRLPFALWPSPAGSLTILIYHRVLPLPDPLRPGESHAALFDRQMAMLARRFKPMPLLQAVQALREGRLHDRAVCVTFDDGYADNLTVAQPILARHGIPATVFVATGYLDGGRMFNDAVIDAVAAAGGDALDLRDQGLGLHPLGTVQQRRAAILQLLNQLRYLPAAAREPKVASVIRAAGGRLLTAPPMLSTTQLRELASRGVQIGGHTISHTVLTSLSPAQAEAEIDGGRQHLQVLLDCPVREFAYPNGRPARDFDASHAALIERLGFALAVSTAPGAVTAASADCYQLPRFTPWGSSVLALSARLARNVRAGAATAS